MRVNPGDARVRDRGRTCSVASSTRHATRATTLRDRTIGAGDCVLLAYPAANRDEAVWGDDAERFDVRRDHAGRRHGIERMPVVFRT